MQQSLPPNEQESLILIVDDIPRNVQVLGSILSENGYGVSVAANGLSALEAVQAQMPDLILLDVQMPDMDGFEACKRLKENPATAHIPVIFLTARTEIDDVVKGFEVGAVDYITKPFISLELLARVRTHLRLQNAISLLAERNSNGNSNGAVASVQHATHTPLSRIRALAGELHTQAPTLQPQDIQRFADKILQAVQNMENV